MATYKVIQDIEAEDKLLGPLTLRQFLYAAIAIVGGFIAFRLGTVNFLLAVPFLPVVIFFGALAAPIGGDQPTEVWMLARIRFFLKPRRRIWDQSGIKELVTITAPKRIEKTLTKNFSETEVKSRLEALANTIDSRGWAIKNVNVNLFSQPAYIGSQASDRLIDVSSLPQEVSNLDIQATDDMLDEQSNPTAQHFDQMIAASTQAHKQQAVARMQSGLRSNSSGAGQTTAPQATNGSQPVGGSSNTNIGANDNPPPDYWFMRGDPAAAGPVPAGFATFQKSQVVTPGSADDKGRPATGQSSIDEQALLQKIHLDQNKPNPAYGHMRVLRPLDDKKTRSTNTGSGGSTNSGQPANHKAQTSSPSGVNPAILELAGNDDLNVATIARQADKEQRKEPPGDEVVVSLR